MLEKTIEWWEMLRNIRGEAQDREKKKRTQRQRKRKDTVNLYKETKSLHSSSESSSLSYLGSVQLIYWHYIWFFFFRQRLFFLPEVQPTGVGRSHATWSTAALTKTKTWTAKRTWGNSVEERQKSSTCMQYTVKEWVTRKNDREEAGAGLKESLARVERKFQDGHCLKS